MKGSRVQGFRFRVISGLRLCEGIYGGLRTFSRILQSLLAKGLGISGFVLRVLGSGFLASSILVIAA